MIPILTAQEAVRDVQDGATLMIGGFLVAGFANRLCQALLDKGVQDLTVICNDPGTGALLSNELVRLGRVKKLITSYIGRSPHTYEMMNAGTLDVELSPQGTLAERIRMGGAGLGGFLTPTGVGTVAQEGKRIIEVEGVPYLLELPLVADFAFIRARRADSHGNLRFHGTARNMNPMMATAANRVICEVDEVVQGAFAPDEVEVSGLFIDALVRTGGDAA